ncbi:hypothetical protein Cfor_04679, partial [Coptotermes formosanus]
QVLPQMLEHRRVGTVAAVRRSDPSSSPRHSGDSNMIPIVGKAAQQSPLHQVTITTLFIFAVYHT